MCVGVCVCACVCVWGGEGVENQAWMVIWMAYVCVCACVCVCWCFCVLCVCDSRTTEDTEGGLSSSLLCLAPLSTTECVAGDKVSRKKRVEAEMTLTALPCAPSEPEETNTPH